MCLPQWGICHTDLFHWSYDFDKLPEHSALRIVKVFDWLTDEIFHSQRKSIRGPAFGKTKRYEGTRKLGISNLPSSVWIMASFAWILSKCKAHCRARWKRNFQFVPGASCGLGHLPGLYSYLPRFLSSMYCFSLTVKDKRQSSSNKLKIS